MRGLAVRRRERVPAVPDAEAEPRTGTLVYHAFDLLQLAGWDLRPMPLEERKRLLRLVLREHPAVPYDEDEITRIVEDTLDACRRFDRESLANSLNSDASLLGVRRFLRERVAPLLEEIGNAWAQGAIEIRHEHFFSEVLEDVLRGLRLSMDAWPAYTNCL